MWLFDGTTTTSLKQIMRIDGPIIVGGPSVDFKCWRQILAAVAEELSPPVEHVLLRDSRQGVFENQTRRVVLDAATAAEISLAALLDKELESIPTRVQRALRDSNRTLERLTKILRKTFGVNLRSDIESSLIAIRNRSIHGGFKPSLDEAKRALEIAAEVVEMANPRSGLLQKFAFNDM